MNRLNQLFKTKPKNNLNIYFTAGFPELNDTAKIITELDKAGVDLIEIGMPYSDPMADGETIQQSSAVALKNGLTLHILFEQLATIREKTDKPLVLMGYLNQLLQYGLDAFCKKAKASGIDGFIIPDMPLYTYEKEYKKVIEPYGIHCIFLVTPRTTDERIKTIDELSNGFIYLVADSSITGKSGEITQAQINYFERINAMKLKNPILIGFGISTKESFNTVNLYSNGAIIGSAFIRHLQAGKPVSTFVKSIID